MWGDPPMPFMLSALMAVSSMVFGGLHCLAWNAQFPSKTEQVLWRVASLVSAALPGVALAITSIINVLAATVSEESHLASVLDTLTPLHRLPEEYWDLLDKRPEYFKWPRQSWFVFRTRLSQQQLPDSLDWEEEPALTSELPPDAKQETTYDDRPRAIWEQLRRFIRCWREVKQGVIYRQFANPRFLLEYDWILQQDEDGGSSHNFELCARHWRAYEAYLKTKLRDLAPDLRGFCVRDFIPSNRARIEALKEKKKAFEKNCNRASTFVTISSGILYAVSRLVILVLLFTSLRSVPEGVYEDSPWTRFLPSIS
jgi:hypothetical protein